MVRGIPSSIEALTGSLRAMNTSLESLNTQVKIFTIYTKAIEAYMSFCSLAVNYIVFVTFFCVAIAVIVVGTIFTVVICWNLYRPNAAANPDTTAPKSITVLPSIDGMNASQIKKAICEWKVRELLSPNQDLGKAIDNGDCFYDAIAQLLRAQGIAADVQSLRNDIHIALSDPQWRQHLEDRVRQDPRGIGSFDQYCLEVGLATDQMGTKAPVWGDAGREGVILCDKYKFNLRVLQAGLIEGNILGDEQLTTSSNLKQYLQEHEPLNPLIATHEANYQARYRELCNIPANYYPLEQIVPKDSPHPVTLTIALFGDHFIPVVSR
jgi:hypothetical protein